jgi:hypothetical protein
MTGNGTWPKKAFLASHTMTLLSLPSDHSMASFSIRLKASRRM